MRAFRLHSRVLNAEETKEQPSRSPTITLGAWKVLLAKTAREKLAAVAQQRTTQPATRLS